MKLLHTSDWHLGQNFFGKSRAAEHEAFLCWLLGQVREQQADALLVVGDVFDTGTPPSYARELYNRFIVELRDTGCQLVVLGGNHDSVSMLNESRGLLACLNVQVVAHGAAVGQSLNEQVLVLNELVQGTPGAIVCAVPYLRPRDLLVSQANQSAADKQQALLQAMADHYATLYAEAQRQQAEIAATHHKTVPIILTGHLMTAGVTTSESVRELYVGTLEAFPASAFPPADYLALGHIHRPQRVAGQEHLRYCGSPLPLSFDELPKGAGSGKEVLLVEWADQTAPTITALPIPLFQPMATLKGDLLTLERELLKYRVPEEAPNPNDTEADNFPTTWLSLEVHSDKHIADLQGRVQALVQDLPVEVLLLKRQRHAAAPMLSGLDNLTLHELSVEEVFSRRLAQESWVSADASEDSAARQQRLTGLFREVLAEVQDAPQQGASV